MTLRNSVVILDYVHSLGFSLWEVMLFAKKIVFFSYPIPMAFFYSFIYSFIVLYLTELPVQCWIEVRRHSCLLLILEEKYWVFCYEFNVSCGFYIDGFCQVEDFLSYFKFSDSFYDEKNWILSNVFLHLFGHKIF